jgi:hypothetical protein
MGRHACCAFVHRQVVGASSGLWYLLRQQLPAGEASALALMQADVTQAFNDDGILAGVSIQVWYASSCHLHLRGCFEMAHAGLVSVRLRASALRTGRGCSSAGLRRCVSVFVYLRRDA